ncbi:chitobiosyldiphosphodolichol beta-mannosyltransferase [Schistocerca serialis cubense]|uniref:chitobiosyldiphosphodolichol beta-mannosyltransferase n=1 Tax=Schistocerca serialis cubense TaxID=2023355 RepID=UPI00214DFD91|nr:chitobiosyldiphosphodolichol beta-mannosyltransferase [Schistocerca serialis cubense]
MVRKNVAVVVLGDIGRSPRMQYHALSFAKEGFEVDLIGYDGSEPIKELVENSHVNFHYMRPCPEFLRHCPRMVLYALKVIWQSLTLLFALLFKKRSNHVLVQNPPAVPTLAVCWFYSLCVRANYVIDWHNYGYSIMALTLGKSHKLIRVSELFERTYGKLSDGNICVTAAMKTDLKENWGIMATTHYDRPPHYFRPITDVEKHNLFQKLAQIYPVFGSNDDCVNAVTAFTKMTEDGKVLLRHDRPALLVSSTSWTEDEDFSILLSALQEYEDARNLETASYPYLVCAVTGKGPLKDYYKTIIADKQWKNVKIITPWLQPEDYPTLLASADLGVCLHTSSSGLDLPMKVVDMFGCGLPVCAYSYGCLHELVKHKINGYEFTNSSELSEQLQTWFYRFPENETQQRIAESFRYELRKFQQLRWHENWKFNVMPIFTN